MGLEHLLVQSENKERPLSFNKGKEEMVKLDTFLKSNRANRLKEEKLRLLEIASNCSVPGEPSSRTIERAQEFKKYIQEQ